MKAVFSLLWALFLDLFSKADNIDGGLDNLKEFMDGPEAQERREERIANWPNTGAPPPAAPSDQGKLKITVK